MRFLRRLFPAKPKVSSQAFEAALAPLRAEVAGTLRPASASTVHRALLALETQALGLPPYAPQRGWLFETLSRLQVWRNDTGAVLHYGMLALRIHDQRPFLDAQACFALHDRMARAADYEGAVPQALHHAQAALDIHPSPWLAPEERLALREKVGYLLHETGDHAQAMAHNTRLLFDTQQHYGDAPDVLCQLLNNLAQNAYALQRFADCQHYLQQRLALAQTLLDYETEADCLFQLGMVDCEQGDPDGARTWFDLRVQRARSLNDPQLVSAALKAQHALITRLGSSQGSRS